jgi:hypothetical protein
MEKLIATTEKLLIANDHAVIPGLGGFFVQQQSAEYCDGRILPPGAGISFNAIVQHNDGYMAIELMRSEGIGYKEANVLIRKESEEFLKKLEKEQSLAFGKCGVFSLNESHQLVFTPALNPAFLPANMGVKSIRTSVPESKKKITLVPVYQAIWKYAAIIAIVLTFFVNNKIEKPDSSSMAGILPSNIISVEEMKAKEAQIKHAVPVLSENKEIITKKDIKVLPEAETSVQKNEEYQVIVAVLDSEKRAQQYCESIKSETYPDALITKSKAGHRVVLKSFDSKSEAEKFASALRKSNQQFSDAWVGKK